MRLLEYRIVLPFSVEEYQRGQIYTVAEGSLRETGGGSGVHVLTNESFREKPLFNGQYSSGQFTKKIYCLEQKLSPFWRRLFAKEALRAEELSWNAYPYSRTEITNTEYFDDKFCIGIESMHIGNDKGEIDNVFKLESDDLSARKIVRLNIATDTYMDKGELNDPNMTVKSWRSTITGRGPLTPETTWMTDAEPVMCVYKLVRIKFKKFGLQTIVESRLEATYPRVFTRFHRQMVMWTDEWHPMSVQIVRQFEREAEAKLTKQMAEGEVKGFREGDD